jgi:ABC-type Fe3+ transport system permease subunit
MKKVKIIIASLAIVLSIFGLSFTPAPTYAANSICGQPNVSEEIKKANGCGGSSTTDLSNVIVGIINGIVAILGIVAAIFVIVGGVNYMTSQGDPGKLQKAKNTILYSVIGLIIAALAFAIVNFVVANILKGDGGGRNSAESSETTTEDNSTD